MCHEGGCGSCIVAVTSKNAFTRETSTYAVNSVSFSPVTIVNNIDIIFSIQSAHRWLQTVPISLLVFSK